MAEAEGEAPAPAALIEPDERSTVSLWSSTMRQANKVDEIALILKKMTTLETKLANRTVVKHPGVEKPADFKPYVPPAPKEKKGRPLTSAKSRRQKERLQRLADVDYGRPYTKRRRRRDPDGDAEEGEGL